jgi:hypothetical protein
MTLNRDNFVATVIDCVLAASTEQLQRGPRVAFFEDGERGIDAGGLTREMYSTFSRQTLEAPAAGRLFKMTAANRLQPEPCAVERDREGWETQYQGYGRVCGMALCTGELRGSG